MSIIADKAHAAWTWKGFAWWRRALLAWLPPAWRARLGLGAERVLLFRQPTDEAMLLWQHGTHVQIVATVPLPLDVAALERLLPPRGAWAPRWIVLPSTQVLRRALSLPAAAAGRLRDVAGFEIDRQTPFPAEAVEFDARLGDASHGANSITAELVVVPRGALTAVRQALGEVATELAGVEVMEESGALLGVNLLAPEARAQTASPLWRWHLALVSIAGVALVLAGHRLVLNRQAAVAAFAAQVEQQATQARMVAAQRQQLDELIEGAAFFARKRAAQPAVVEVLDELSQRVPTDTYLERLSIQDNHLQLMGLSPQAPALVAKLDGATHWHTPALSGPLQRDVRLPLDHFTVNAELSSAPATGAADAH